MEIDPLNPPGSDDTPTSTADARARRLNTWVAVTVALLATFMGICKVKDDNLVQAMQQAQADKLDHWAFYQARNIRQEVAQASLDQLRAIRANLSDALTAIAIALLALTSLTQKRWLFGIAI